MTLLPPGFYETVEMLLFGMSLSLPPLAWFARKFVLPSPGEGPSVATMDAGYLKITAYGKGSEGGKAKAIIYFPTDPGYRDTARMLVESGLSLSLEGDRIPVGGGVWTPASCMADVLLERLCNTGTKFCIE